MIKISDIEYYYNLILNQNKQQKLNFNSNFNSNTCVNNLTYCIYYETKLNLISKYNIISQNVNDYYDIFIQQTNLIYQGILDSMSSYYHKTKKKIKHKVKKVATEVFGEKFVNKAEKAWNYCKNISSKIINQIKKLGQAIYNWFDAAISYMKEGFSLLFEKAPKKDMGFAQPNNIVSYHSTIKKYQKTAFSALSCQQSLEKMKNNKIGVQGIKKIRNTLINGGNADKVMESTLKDIGNNSVESLKAELTNNKDIAKQENSRLKKSIENNKDSKLLFQNFNLTYNNNLKNYFDKLSFQKNIQLKEYLIEQAFNGKTPKMCFNNNYSRQKQNDIIIGGSKLSFKTTNGYLICEETNLKTNNTIIYESNTPFIGKHLIYETTQNKFKINNNIITEDDQNSKNEQNSDNGFKLCWADIIVIGKAILTIVTIFLILITAIQFIIACYTYGITLVAAPVVAAGTTPPVAILSFNGIFGILSVIGLIQIPDLVKEIPNDIKQVSDQLGRKPINLYDLMDKDQKAQYEKIMST